MKRTLLLFFSFTFACYSAYAQLSRECMDSDCAKFSFTRDTIDFGALEHSSVGHYELKYANKGKCPLIISPLKGVSNREYRMSKIFLQAGDTGILSIYYPADETGPFFRIITFYSNAISSKQLYLKGIVKPRETCAAMTFAKDTIDMGPVHYIFGKHFTVKVASTGKCPLLFTAPPTEDYMNVMNHTQTPVSPGDSGIIDVHIGGAAIGHYYGILNIYSSNAMDDHKALFIKADLLSPDKIDSTDSKIQVDTDMIDIGKVSFDGPSKQLTVNYTVKSIGTKPLIFKRNVGMAAAVETPKYPIFPGSTCTVKVTYRLPLATGPFIKFVTLQGNFTGKTMLLYLKGFKAK